MAANVFLTAVTPRCVAIQVLIKVFPTTFEFVADKTDPVQIHPHGKLFILLLHLPVAGAFLGKRLVVQSQGEHDIRPDFPGMQRPVEPPELYGVVAVEEAMQIEEMVAAVVIVPVPASPVAFVPDALDLRKGFGFDP